MNEEALRLVLRELEHAGVTPEQEQMLERLEERRITPEKELPQMEFLFRLFHRPCFPRGELVALSGKAKSGKTFVGTILMALCQRSPVLSLERIEPRRLHVLWYDTEQSEESTQDILKHRVLPMTCGTGSDMIDVFNVRGEMYAERLPLLEMAVRHYRPDLVIVDGIRDFVAVILIGNVAGCYSSIFVSPMITAYWHKEERNISSNAMWMGREAFINIYRYMIRYMERYHGVAYRVLFTVNMTSETLAKEERADVMDRFRCMMQESLRNSDLMVEVSENQIFLLLPQTQEFGIDVVIKRLSTKWHQSAYSEKAAITWETGKVHLTDRAAPAKKPDWVVVAGGGENRDQIAEMLDRQQFRVSAPASGQALSELIIAARPDLILLDADTDGIEILRALKSGSPEVRDIPVILMVGGGTPELEERALELGAEDLIVRPFSPTLLALRVRHTIDRVRLQRSHAFELSMQPIERR